MIFSSMRAKKKEERQKQERSEGLKIGDKVITIGGLVGTVVRKGEDDFDIETGDGKSVVTFTLAALNTVVGDEEGK